MNPALAIDFYKTDHRRQYPEGTNKVYSNLTARSSHLSNIPQSYRDDKVVFFGLQYYLQKHLIEDWTRHFFDQSKHAVLTEYKGLMSRCLGVENFDVSHLSDLHDLGHIPISVLSLPEGTVCPIKVPMLTIENTHPDFYWITNYLETALSAIMWKPIVNATTARFYRRLFEDHAKECGLNGEYINFQGHDFSMRGMSGIEDAALSGAAHLTSFVGTDCLPAVKLIEQYYEGRGCDLIGASVPATEHSVMCMGGKNNEFETFDRLAFDIYPTGIVSIVADTWDFWSIITKWASSRKERILQREGKVVFRPDSGDPVKIICGDPAASKDHERLGAVACLAEIFGTTNKGTLKELNEKVGVIYGDSITPQRAIDILEGLKTKGYTPNNIVLGIGSFTYQYVTRDTWGMAIKATYGEINEEPQMIFKDPLTDSGVKKSLKGRINVYRENGTLLAKDGIDRFSEPKSSLLVPTFLNGDIIRTTNIDAIRKTVRLG